MPKVSKTKVIYRSQPYVSWEGRLEELKQYKEKYGNCNIPQRYKDDPKLGQWVDRQRQAYKKGKLSSEQIESLNGIGFEWELSPRVVSWDERLTELKQYKRVNGHCRVPGKYTANQQLANWVAWQRHEYKKGKLLPEQIKSMNGIGFEWVLVKHTVRVSWDVRFDQLVEYKDKYGHCNISTLDGDNKQLGQWVHTQRTTYNKGKLPDEKINRLEGIGFSWAGGVSRGRRVLGRGKPSVGWDERFKELVQFKDKNRHCNVPRKYPKLGSWVKDQRQLYKKNKLLPDQIKLLKGIGFSLSPDEDKWNERLEELKQYKQVNRDCNIPRKYKANPPLASWVNTNRTKYKNGKLSKERIESLQGIGFSWVGSRAHRRQAQKASDVDESSSGGEEEEAGEDTSSGDIIICVAPATSS